MGIRFRKSIKIAPGARINLSKSGASLSVGPRGAKVNLSSRGVRTTVGLPGTGLSYSTTGSRKAQRGTPGKSLVATARSEDNGLLTSSFDDEDFLANLGLHVSNLSVAELQTERARFNSWLAACDAEYQQIDEDKASNALECLDAAIEEKRKADIRSAQVFLALSFLSAGCLFYGLKYSETGATIAGLIFGGLAVSTPVGRALITLITALGAGLLLLAIGGGLLYVAATFLQAATSH